tara:strand:- start:1279 stop:2256 length:978 start_codon:yes stop_codon:yes gene_type:complete
MGARVEYSDDYLREVLPEGNPPSELVPRELEVELSSIRERSEGDWELIARSARWTHAMFSELGSGQFILSRFRFPYPWEEGFFSLTELVRQLAIGLFDPSLERKGFGLIATLPAWEGPSFHVVAEIKFPRLRQIFPLVFRHALIEPHALQHPHLGTSACWAQCRTSRQWGILTSGHVVGGNGIGFSVPMASGQNGALIRSFYQPVDAAFVDIHSKPDQPTLLPYLRFPAAGQSVIIQTKAGALQRRIVAPMNASNVYHTREFAVLVQMDKPCEMYDSGALVSLPSGEAVGIYKGKCETEDTATPIVGLIQSMQQATYALNVDPFL